MKQQKMLIPTLREVPSDAEVISHKLMLRAGMIRQLAAGVYSWLPLGYKVLKNVEAIVREEIDRAGAQEIFTSAIQPAELWKKSGRWDAYGPELMRLADRHGRDFVLGPTHEEIFTTIIAEAINSYKKLPINIYQIQSKFRDERRPRFGVIRAREFIMKDAYSFDVDKQGLDQSYQSMYDAYHRIFKRCALNYRAVDADAGVIGGKGGTHEFMALSEIGEDTIVHCSNCDYAANIEKAETNMHIEAQMSSEQQEKNSEYQIVATPDCKTVNQVAQYLQVETSQIIKTMLFEADKKTIAALVRGDDEVNETKLKNVLDANVLKILTDDEVIECTALQPGYIGPVRLADDIMIIADNRVLELNSAIVGANKPDYHMQNVKPNRDFIINTTADIRTVQEGESCIKCGKPVQFSQGIEVGHIFKLGTKYSEAMGATYLNENGSANPIEMGCYGIGVSRTVAAVVEQHCDDQGIIWPKQLAPWQVHIIPINIKDEHQSKLAIEMYELLLDNGLQVLFDDRAERAGVKFKDADLIGIPLRIVVGKASEQGIVELKYRKNGQSQEIQATQIVDIIKAAWDKL